MTASLPPDMPTGAELAAALRPLFAATTGAMDAVVVARRPNAYTSSSRSEVVTIRDPRGDHRNYLVKYDRGGRDPTPSCRHGIDYCGRVYESLLAALPLCHLRTLGTIRVGPTAVPALVIEHLDDSFRVGEAPEVSGILAAAEWCGCFHHLAEPRQSEPALGFLVRYDRGYYQAWADRAERLAATAARSGAWLSRACAAFHEMAGDLAAAPTTIIHGEMSPQNVLWRNGEIYPVDWESAAIGPGEIDLAALLLGWPEETVARCIEAYWEALRKPRPSEFATRWAAATLYTALRWLPSPDAGDDPRFSLALDRLRETASAVGVV